MRDGGDNRPGSEFPFGGGRHRTNGTNGVHPEGMRTRRVPMSEIDDPIDLVAVQADDELINALQAGMAVSAPGLHGYDADDHMVAMLAAWKAEVDAEPIPELLDTDSAMAAIDAARPSTARRARRHLGPVAAAAAFVVLAIGGVSIGSAGSEPGDALWAVSKVLYSERAQSVEAAVRVENRIDTAKKALAQGQTDVATQELQAARAELATVRPQEGKADLTEVQSFLLAKVDETPPGVPTDPGAPLNTDRARRVPQGAVLPGSPTPVDPRVVPTINPSSVPIAPTMPAGAGAGNPGGQGGGASTAPTTSPAVAVPEPTGSAGPTTAPVGGVPVSTTPSQGLGGAAGVPRSSTTAAGAGAGRSGTGAS